MKSKSKAFVLVSLLVLVGFIGMVSKVNASVVDIDYIFQNDNLYETTTPLYSDSFNYRNASEYTETYNGTYSFTGETGLENLEIPFIDFIDIEDNYAVIESNVNNHSEVLNITASADYSYVRHYYAGAEEGTIEFWISAKQTNLRLMIHIADDSIDDGLMISLYENGNFQYYNGSFQDTGVSYSANTWYHFKIDFDCDVNFDWHVNGVEIASDISLMGTPIAMNYFIFRMKTNCEFYLDAFGTSWNIPENTYDGTYSFTGEIEGTNPDHFTFNESGGTINVIDSEANHSKVVELHDTSGVDLVGVNQAFTEQTTGTIEFWFRSTNTFAQTSFRVWAPDLSTGVWLLFAEDWILHRHPEGYAYLQTIDDNIWYHIRIDFDTDTDFFTLTVDGINTYTDLEFYVNQTSLKHFDLDTHGASQNYYSYLDALGYSWDTYYDIGDNWFTLPITNYSIGDNLIPYLEVNTSLQEVDKWEFSFSDFPTQYAIGSDVFSDWTEDDTGDHINIAKDYNALDGMPLYFPDRKIKIEDHVGSSADIGIERDFEILDGIIDISWSFNFTSHEGVEYLGETTIEIYSSDDTLISQIYSKSKNLCYKDSGTGEVVLDYDVCHEGEYFDFNFYWNPYDDVIFLKFDIDGVQHDIYGIPNLDSSKKGLGKIKFKNYNHDTKLLILYLDNIGVYSNGTSLSTEPAFRQIDLDDGLFHANWDFPEANLLTLNLKGNIGIHLTDWYFYIGSTTIEEVLSAREFNGTDIRYNLYDHTFNSQNYIYSPRFWFEFYDQIEFTDDYLISMNGVVLDDGVTNYHLEFTSQNVIIDESYFYVSGGHLYYSITYDDSDLEYIQASFDITNVAGENRSARYYSDTNGNYAEMRLKYTDTTVTALALQTSYYISNIILNQEKSLDKFELLITDDDKLSTGITTGRISGITLQYLPNIAITITTLDLLGMITVLIIIIIPTLVVSRRVGTKVIIPMLFLMCLLCVATELIPIWLFVVITISLGSFYIVNSKIKGGM